MPPPRDTQVPEEVHRALLRGLTTAPEQRFSSMEELLNELSLQQGDDAAGRRLSRKRFLSWFVGVGVIALLVLQLRQSQRSLNPRDLITAMGMVLGAALAAGLYYRKTLLGNRFHRALWFLCTANMVENMMSRCPSSPMSTCLYSSPSPSAGAERPGRPSGWCSPGTRESAPYPGVSTRPAEEPKSRQADEPPYPMQSRLYMGQGALPRGIRRK